MDITTHVFSISSYIDLLNEQLSLLKARVIGEITTVKISDKGHVYFTIKDKTSGGVLDCAIWSGKYRLSGVSLRSGMEIIVSGKGNLYAPSGRFSFIADTVELVGEGALKKSYEDLRKRYLTKTCFSSSHFQNHIIISQGYQHIALRIPILSSI